MSGFSLLVVSASTFFSRICSRQGGSRERGSIARALSSRAERAVPVELHLESSSRPHELKALDLTFPTYVVWGAGTGVGKTLVSAGLTASILLHRTQAGTSRQERAPGSGAHTARNVVYLKPVQTGFPKDSDASFVLQQVYRTVKARPAAASEEFYLSNQTVQASPAVHAAIKASQSSALRSDDSLLSQSHNPGMRDLYSYEEHVIGLDKDKVGCGEELVANPTASHLSCKTLWSWFHPVSPHLAAVEEQSVVTDISILETLKGTLWKPEDHHVPNEALSSHRPSMKWAIIETAGGVASPAPSGTLQCDLYRPLRLPGLLVGDGKLGGISSTIAAYESLCLRGYDIDAVILLDYGLGNEEALQKYFRNRIPVIGLPSIPQSMADDLGVWYQESETVFTYLQNILEQAHVRRLDRLQSLPAKAMKSLWWPFTQHSLVSKQDVTVIDSRCGENFSVFEVDHDSNKYLMKEQFDGCASWWTQGPNAELQLNFARAMAYAAGRYGHVMFPENVHEPSLRCAELLLQGVGEGWADRVYFSDNGSTAIEIAIKMAFRKFAVDHGYAAEYETAQPSSAQRSLQFKVLALKGSYHGDTLGAMEAQAPSAFTGFLQQPWYSGRGLFLDPPTVSLQDRSWSLHLPDAFSKGENGRNHFSGTNETTDPTQSVIETHDPNSRIFDGGVVTASVFWNTREDIFSESRDVTRLAQVYGEVIEETLGMSASRDEHSKIAALIIEPVIHAAGGMHMLDPLFQRVLVQKCRQHRIPVIFDEVFAGCWRLGAQSAAELLRITPDIACYSKLLTGGMVPLAATLASEAVFETFRGQSKLRALLHGHSYTAHPLGCAAAVTALESFADSSRNPNLVPRQRRLKELWDPLLVNAISGHAAVKRVVSLGTLFALELRADPSQSGYASMRATGLLQCLRHEGVYARPLGNVVYLLCGPTTQPGTCTHLLKTLISQLDRQQDYQI